MLVQNTSGSFVKRALLMGAFSTVGDVEVLHQVEMRMRDQGIPFDVAPFSRSRAAMFDHWVDVSTLEPSHYSHIFFVCGPLTCRMMEKRLKSLKRFSHCAFVGLNLTMVADIEVFNPFEVLIERDSNQCVRPDLSFVDRPLRVPVVGLCLVASQREYGSRQRHSEAQLLLRDLIHRSGVAAIEIDTRLTPNPANAVVHGFSNTAQFESAISRFDVILTTRLHGMVLALKNAVPVIAIDAVVGGDKVSRQARVIGWPEAFDIENVTDQDLDQALERCLSADARQRAQASADRAMNFWQDFDCDFTKVVDATPNPALRSSLIRHPGFFAKLFNRSH